MTYEILDLTIRSVRPNPENNYQKIEFIGEVDGKTVPFDPFVSCHLEWYQARDWIGRDISFKGFLGGGDHNIYLISDLLEVK